ncbi:MAG: DNA polymerase IV [Clostridiales bacterium]|nr:DNA polymerase IV [Clostridiales bacterium]
MERKILHVDMDAFFAAVEIQVNPDLKGKPVIVGGTSSRGIVATASYEARKYGIHSAMPIFIAKQKCPHGIYLPTRHSLYRQVSRQIFDILYEVTDVIEPLSIDEAYLDISNNKSTPMEIVKYIKDEVMKKTGLTLSIGISYNKFLAKLASDWNKPDGLMIITKDMVPNILRPLPINKVYGVGKKTEKRLNSIGIYTVDDLMNLSEEYLEAFLGKLGRDIYHMIRGIDDREVEVHREVKSIGRERTLAEDTRDKNFLRKLIKDFAMDIGQNLNKRNLYAKTITIKTKNCEFTNHTRSRTLDYGIQDWKEIYKIALEILDEIILDEDIRLIGLSTSNFMENNIKQLSFF